jgi:hypothetical protein
MTNQIGQKKTTLESLGLQASAAEVDGAVAKIDTVQDVTDVVTGLTVTSAEVSSVVELSSNVTLFGIDNTKTITNANMFSYSTNLYNLDTDIQHKAISSSGVEVDNLSYHSTDYIYVEEGQQYNTYGFLNLCYYNASKEFVSPRQTLVYTGSVVTIPTGVAFIRLHYQYSSSVKPRQVNKGATKLAYEPYYVSFKNKSLEFINTQKADKQSNIIFDMDVPTGIYRKTGTISDYTGLQTSLHTDMYTLFDSLVDSGYCTKQSLASNSYGHPIYKYNFIPTKPINGSTEKRLKVLITCGVHGFEKATTICTYLMFKDIIEKSETDQYMEFLRNKIDFHVVPVVNPSGWDDFTRKSRGGVDLNRNYKKDWYYSTDTASSTYPGTGPYSEIETQNIKSILDAVQFDAVIDFHNFHLGSNGDYFAYFFSASDAFLHNLAQSLFAKLTREWKKDLAYITDNYFIGRTEATSMDAMLQNEAVGRGIKYSCTLEMCNRWVLNGGVSSVTYDDDTMRCGTELLVNYIMTICKHIARES